MSAVPWTLGGTHGTGDSRVPSSDTQMLPVPPFLFTCLRPAHGGELVRVVTASRPLFPERRLHFPPAPHHLPSPEPGVAKWVEGSWCCPTHGSVLRVLGLSVATHGHCTTRSCMAMPLAFPRDNHTQTLIPDEPWI